MFVCLLNRKPRQNIDTKRANVYSWLFCGRGGEIEINYSIQFQNRIKSISFCMPLVILFFIPHSFIQLFLELHLHRVNAPALCWWRKSEHIRTDLLPELSICHSFEPVAKVNLSIDNFLECWNMSHANADDISPKNAMTHAGMEGNVEKNHPIIAGVNEKWKMKDTMREKSARRVSGGVKEESCDHHTFS